jgi:hypothetical protein
MANNIHDSLKYLAPTNWSDLPRDSLAQYLTPCFRAAELLVNTVPAPASGTPFDNAQPQFTTPNSAKSAKDVHTSSARPAPPDAEHAELQKHWGKPMKYSQKENPLNVALYKMAGNDRHGAWFARHQVLEGISFSKMKRALMREFPETLLVQGAPGAGAKRGLSAERRVERIDVDGVGRVEVYQLSAQMPSPVSPRDFLTLLLTTEDGLTEKSSAEAVGGERHVPRSYMIISRPLDHEGAPQRSSFVRGQYESVELIREIPLHVSKSTLDVGEGKGDDVDPELNPVQWIMITRSDPAGGVPRFLVDRGTPGAMLTDVTKFLDWACAYDEVPHPDSDLKLQREISAQKTLEILGEAAGTGISAGDATIEAEGAVSKVPDEVPETGVQADTAPAAVEESQAATQPSGGGIVSNITSTLGTGVNNYAPATVAGFVNRQLATEADTTRDLSDSSDSSSIDSFISAEEMKRMSTAPEAQSPPRESTENLSVASGASSSELSKSDRKNMTQHEREIMKLTQQREKLDAKLAKKREAEESKLKASQEKEATDQSKARSRMEKEMQKTEERHRKEIEKLESRKERELRKVEERKKKREESNRMALVARERDEWRSQAESLRRENGLLREQVEELQRENTAMTSKIGKLGGGDYLRELGTRGRSGTGRSGESLAGEVGNEKKSG